MRLNVKRVSDSLLFGREKLERSECEIREGERGRLRGEREARVLPMARGKL